MEAIRKRVKVADLKSAPFNPPGRTEAKKLRDLEKSVREYGILMPIAITSDYVIGDGHRRVAIAKKLGIEEVDALIIDASSEEIFSELNKERAKISTIEWGEAYIRSDGRVEPPARTYKNIVRIVEIAGKPGLKEVILRYHKSPTVIAWVDQISNYVGDESTDFLCAALSWMLEQGQQYTVRRAMQDGAPPELITQAIKENKPLNIVYALA